MWLALAGVSTVWGQIIIGPVVNPVADSVIGPVIGPVVNPFGGLGANPVADTAIVGGSPSSLPPSMGGNVVPTFLISSPGSVDVSIKFLMSGCDLEPIELKSIDPNQCGQMFQGFPIPKNHFPSKAILIEEEGAYEIGYIPTNTWETEPLLEVVKDNEISLGQGTTAGSYEIEVLRQRIMAEFRDIADHHCPSRVGPCTGFDIATGDNFLIPQDDSNFCNEKPQNGRVWDLNSQSIYYLRPTALGAPLSASSQASYNFTADTWGTLYVRRLCCSGSSMQMMAQAGGAPTTTNVPTNAASCPCPVNTNSTNRTLLRSIYTTDINNIEYRKLSLFEATLSGDSSYKFRFDPDFDGEIVFYKFSDPTSYSTFTVVDNQAFSATDNLTELTLNNVGDCSTLYMAIATGACAIPMAIGTFSGSGN